MKMKRVVVVDGGTVIGNGEVIKSRGRFIIVRFDSGAILRFDPTIVEIIEITEEDYEYL